MTAIQNAFPRNLKIFYCGTQLPDLIMALGAIKVILQSRNLCELTS